MIPSLVLIFSAVFMFKVPYLRDSAVVASFFCIGHIVFNKNIRKFINFSFNLKPFKIFTFSIIIIFLYSTFVILIFGVNDVSFLFSKILQLFYISLLLPIIYFLSEKGLEQKDIILAIILVFFIQSIIQILAIVFPIVSDFVGWFQYEDAREVALSFGGVRGNALSANLFFGLSASYGLSIMLCGYYLIVSDSNRNIVSIASVFIFLGGLLTGRTFYLGCIFSLFLFLLTPNPKFSLVSRCRFLISRTLLLAVVSIILFHFLPNNLGFKIYNFAFEFIINLSDSGNLQTKSTDRLLEMLAINIGGVKDFLFGYGTYTSFDGLYFMHTDVGYLRNILFFGAIGTFFLVFLFIYWCVVSFSIHNYKYFKGFVFLLVFYCGILHIKGEVFFHMHMISVLIMLLVSFQSNKHQVKEVI